MKARLIYVTVGSLEEAQKIGKELIESRLAACVNLFPGMKSIYRWEGKICEDQEVVLIAKTVKDRVEDLIAKVKELHSYSCPCIVALSIKDGYGPFLKWIGDTVNRRDSAPDGVNPS